MRNTLARGSIFWVGVVAVVVLMVLMALAGTESVLAGSHATAYVSNT